MLTWECKTSNLLAFDTSTEVMSLALQRGTAGPAQRLWQHTAPGGAQTSTQLIPAIQALMGQAGVQFCQLDAIVFGCGPGAFTGLRTACAVAQGLAFGAGIPVLPVDTLLAVAEEARWQADPGAAHCCIQALLDARMDELYAGTYVYDQGRWACSQPPQLVRPEDVQAREGALLAGNVFAAYGARLQATLAPRLDALPTATALLRLAPALLAAGAAVPADQALPLYIRDKVAQTTQERLVQKVLA